MIPYLADVNAYLEAHPNYQPQFLSESQYVPEEQVQMIHRLIEMFRHHLTSREVDVLRNLLLNYQDRCMVCLLYTSPSPRDLSTSRMPSSA